MSYESTSLAAPGAIPNKRLVYGVMSETQLKLTVMLYFFSESGQPDFAGILYPGLARVFWLRVFQCLGGWIRGILQQWHTGVGDVLPIVHGRLFRCSGA